MTATQTTPSALLVRRTADYGASDPLPNVPAKVGLLNRQPTLGPGDRDYSSCPFPVIARPQLERPRWVERGHSYLYAVGA